jgi:hypothetical protein
MNIKTLLETLDKSNIDNAGFYDVEELSYEFNLGGGICYTMDISNDFKEYEHKDMTWMCTDTLVGLFFLFLHDEFVGIRFQHARKYDSEYEWKDQKTFEKVKEWFLEEFKKQIISKKEPEIIDFEQDISSWHEYANKMNKK